jgi:hypothetical protein
MLLSFIFQLFDLKNRPFVGASPVFIKKTLLKKLPCIAKYLAAYYLCPTKDDSLTVADISWLRSEGKPRLQSKVQNL